MEKFWSIPLTQWSCLCFWVQAKELWGGRRGLPTPVWLSLQPHCTVGDSWVHRKTILGLKLIYIHLCQLPRTPCRWVDGSVRATDEKEKGLQPHSRQEGWPEAFCPQLPSLSWPWLYPGRSFLSTVVFSWRMKVNTFLFWFILMQCTGSFISARADSQSRSYMPALRTGKNFSCSNLIHHHKSVTAQSQW